MNWLRERLHLRGFPWAALGVSGLMGVTVYPLTILALWLRDRSSPPSCYGLGWGCSPDPGTMGSFVAVGWFYGLCIAAIGLAVTEPFWRRIAVARSLGALIILGIATMALLFTALASVLAALDHFVF